MAKTAADLADKLDRAVAVLAETDAGSAFEADVPADLRPVARIKTVHLSPDWPRRRAIRFGAVRQAVLLAVAGATRRWVAAKRAKVPGSIVDAGLRPDLTAPD